MSADAEQLRLLAALIAQPADDALDALRDLLPEAPWLGPAIDELAALPLEHWQAEHTRLFVNGYPKTPCPPFEGAYREGQMGGTAREELIRLYRRGGLEASGAPADYLGTLLEFAGHLADQLGPAAEAQAGQSRRPELTEDAAAALLIALWDEHLRQWLPALARDLQEHARLTLYRSLGAQLATLDRPGLPHD